MAQSTTPTRLSTHLLTLASNTNIDNNSSTTQTSFTQATQSPFLRLAGKGQLSKADLSRWLTQDRLYAQMYVRWGALVISGIQQPRRTTITTTTTTGKKPAATAAASSLEERITDMLIAALANVRRELGFFEDVAARYGLRLDVWCEERGSSAAAEGGRRIGRVDVEGMDVGARGYAALFEGLGGGIEGRDAGGLLENFVFLWAMEKCYLEAWTYAKSFLDSDADADSAEGTNRDGSTADEDGGALRKEFVPNWTGPEFVEFVEDIERLMQELWVGECARFEEGHGTSPRERAEGVWWQVLAVERVFWPVLEG